MLQWTILLKELWRSDPPLQGSQVFSALVGFVCCSIQHQPRKCFIAPLWNNWFLVYKFTRNKIIFVPSFSIGRMLISDSNPGPASPSRLSWSLGPGWVFDVCSPSGSAASPFLPALWRSLKRDYFLPPHQSRASYLPPRWRKLRAHILVNKSCNQ